MLQSTPVTLTIAALNGASAVEATQMIGRITERSEWLAGRLAAQRPFTDVADLADRLQTLILNLTREERLVLLRAHPELATPEPGIMTDASKSEQKRLALGNLNAEMANRLTFLNGAYQEHFGFPFIIALHAFKDVESIVAVFEGRMQNAPDVEIDRALNEVVSVARARLTRLFGTTESVVGEVAF
ncbi:2-oxo-4-hydroxy-4-carboxy-5-ureidoimidazoline decarboxylase [Pseudorhodobacter sp. W20_MBD10_FR17]|uniref:2-oxo-4-hydroxy-4-carboxy-5-ureidoimidazoline decarboxylase n=1 Tax=Pseudorhodobacter sp. W20_MBD10_FR17 TaxID=3240266 RepID=UPI003F9E344A